MNEKETIITKSGSPANYGRILFCMKAMGGGRTQPFTRYMHVENARSGSRIVCTDGKRLHVAVISARIPAGNYRPEARDGSVRFGKPEDVAFPSWRNVVPEAVLPKGTVDLEDAGNGTRTERDEKFSRTYCAFLFDTGINVNIGFLRDLPSAKWKVFTQGGKNRLVKLENTEDKNQFAVFVPLAA